MSRMRQVCFACIRTQAKRRVESRLRQGKARRRTVKTKVVKLIMNPHKLAICLEERRIVCNSLIQQVRGLHQITGSLKGITPIENKIFGTAIKIERREIGGRRALDGLSFTR